MEKLPGRNDPCWCGSGKKFKRCHLHRGREDRLALGAVENSLRAEFERKACLHPLAAPGVCTRVIRAHTIQRAAALAAIKDANNKVWSFAPPSIEMLKTKAPRAVGWREASTFPGFCSVHDRVFAPVEDQAFTGSKEQCFLLAYRALCHELHKKRASGRSHNLASSVVDKGLSQRAQRELQTLLSGFQEGVELGIADLEAIKVLMDKELITRNFENERAVVINVVGPVSVAATGAMSPELDLRGRILQALDDKDAHVQPLFVNIIPRAGGASIVLGWRAGNSAPEEYVQSLMQTPISSLPSTLVQLIFAHIENVYFAHAWWESLSDTGRAIVAAHALNPVPYVNVPQPQLESIVPWIVDSVEHVV